MKKIRVCWDFFLIVKWFLWKNFIIVICCFILCGKRENGIIVVGIYVLLVDLDMVYRIFG